MLKTSQLLRRARDIHECRTENGTLPGSVYMGICRSIRQAARGVRQERVAHALIVRVQMSLKPYNWVQMWLEANGHTRRAQHASGSLMTQYRLRWLEALAAEYEAKGD